MVIKPSKHQKESTNIARFMLEGPLDRVQSFVLRSNTTFELRNQNVFYYS